MGGHRQLLGLLLSPEAELELGGTPPRLLRSTVHRPNMQDMINVLSTHYKILIKGTLILTHLQLERTFVSVGEAETSVQQAYTTLFLRP